MPTPNPSNPEPRYTLPPLGANPSKAHRGTSPSSFAHAPEIGGPLAFSSPDTPGMPAPSDRTAWDFMPGDWKQVDGGWRAPAGFKAQTQLEYARLGIVTPQMQRVAD